MRIFDSALVELNYIDFGCSYYNLTKKKIMVPKKLAKETINTPVKNNFLIFNFCVIKIFAKKLIPANNERPNIPIIANPMNLLIKDKPKSSKSL